MIEMVDEKRHEEVIYIFEMRAGFALKPRRNTICLVRKKTCSTNDNKYIAPDQLQFNRLKYKEIQIDEKRRKITR